MKNFILFNLIVGIISCSNIVSLDTHFKELQNVKNQLTCLSVVKATIDEEDHSWSDPFYTLEDLHKSLERRLKSEKINTDQNLQISKLYLKYLEQDQYYYDLFKYFCPCFFTHSEKQYNCDWDRLNKKNDELEKRIKLEEEIIFFKKKMRIQMKALRDAEYRTAVISQYINEMTSPDDSLQNKEGLGGQSEELLVLGSELRQRKNVTFKMSDRSPDFDESA